MGSYDSICYYINVHRKQKGYVQQKRFENAVREKTISLSFFQVFIYCLLNLNA